MYFFKTDQVLNMRNLIKQPIIFIRIIQNRRKSLIDSDASIIVITEHSVLKTCDIEKCNKSTKDISGKLNIIGRIFTDIENGGIKTMERLVVISKEHKMPDEVISVKPSDQI